MSKYIENEIEHIDDQIEYGLLRAHNTMGGMTPTLHNIFVIEDNKFIKKELTYTPALVKSACEVIDNSIDESIRCFFEKGNIIKISIENNKIIVEDNGRGIPTKNDNKGNPMFVTALTNVQAGSNFRDDKNNNKKGTNGIGSSMAFILSKEADCETKTDETFGILKTSNNTRKIDYKIKDKKHRKTGTKITILPDYERFGVDTFDEIHQQVLYSYIVNQSVCYPEIKFSFNNEEIKASNFKDYIKFYSDNAYLFYSDEILDIAVYPTDEYSYTYFINGLNVYDGGDALDYIVNSINTNLKNHAPKKFSKLTASNFKNRLGYIVIYKNRTDLDWNGQTKQKCNSTFSKLQSPKIDWNVLTKILYKDKSIINPILELFKIQEEFEARKSLENLVKPQKKIRIDKYKPAISENRYLMLSEGLSASSSILAGTGREVIGAYPMKGKPINCMKASIQQIKKNQEIKDILEIMGIDLSKDLETLETNYKYILVASDADLDGFQIRTLAMSFFMKYYPDFIKQGRFKILNTPVIIIYKNNKPFKYFISLESYNIFIEKDKTKYDVKYKKGLASLTEKEFEWLFKDGIEPFIETLEWDENSEERYNEWMSGAVDKRKEYLIDKSFSIFDL